MYEYPLPNAHLQTFIRKYIQEVTVVNLQELKQSALQAPLDGEQYTGN